MVCRQNLTTEETEDTEEERVPRGKSGTMSQTLVRNRVSIARALE
jgi:hypothetical protein